MRWRGSVAVLFQPRINLRQALRTQLEAGLEAVHHRLCFTARGRGDVRIGEAVPVAFNSFNDGELVLPQFRPMANEGVAV